MPSIKKIITGKMNSDASNDLMPQEDFRDALNLTVDVDGVVSVRGNRKCSGILRMEQSVVYVWLTPSTRV
jgi:hypothetical protein